MGNQSVISIEAVIDYIESHLDGKLELETVAEAVHYSKYHLHRLFTETVGMTIHDYVQRRQLTEAAKLLVFSDKPIIEIAFICGYESQQSFSLAFKAMYKSPPAEYREERSFYPLQLRFTLHRRTTAMEFTIQDIRLAEKKDIVDWMNLMRLVIDGYPVMDEDDYLAKLVPCKVKCLGFSFIVIPPEFFGRGVRIRTPRSAPSGGSFPRVSCVGSCSSTPVYP